jgi:hypothetical protein
MLTIFCLVSRQAMANVLPVLMFNPNKVILFTTPEEKLCADNLENLFSSKHIEVQRIDKLDAYDYYAFKNAVKSELEKSSEEVWLNVTGGTKLMALAAYEAFAEKDKPIIYCNTERNQIIHLFPNLNTEKLKLNLSIKDYLKAYGYDVIFTRTEQFTEEHQQLFNLLIEKNYLQSFSEYLDRFRSYYNQDKSQQTFRERRYPQFLIQKNISNIVLSIDNNTFKFFDDKFLMGDWLEYFVFHYLSQAGFKPEVGVKIKSSGEVENEIDVIFLKDYQLYLISCKSGKPSTASKDIYEIETLRIVAGGTFGKAFLFTTKLLDKKIEKRAEELQVKLINFSNLSELKI